MSFGAFFHPTNFKDILADDQARAVAKRADEILAENAILMFGTVFADGTAEDFSTTKGPTNSHVALAVGARAMAAFVPSDSYIKTEGMKDTEMKAALEQRVKSLEALLSKSGGYGG